MVSGLLAGAIIAADVILPVVGPLAPAHAQPEAAVSTDTDQTGLETSRTTGAATYDAPDIHAAPPAAEQQQPSQPSQQWWQQDQQV